MENLKIFNLEDDYLEIKESLEYPTLSLTDDNGKVWVKEYENYIRAHYIIGNVYDSGVGPDSVDSLGMTNVVGGMQHYSRKIVSTNFVTSSNVRQSSNNGIMMLSLDEETPQIMTLSDNGSNYENITIDTNISLNDYCGCIVHCDETAILNKQIQSLKIKTNSDVSNGSIIPLLFYYRDEPQYDNLDGGNNCSNCNNNWAYDEITQDVFDDINTYFTFEDNNTLVATQEYIDYINQYIEEYNNIFAVCDKSNFETIDFQLIIDDVYTLNVHNVTISKYELQVFDYYETEILKYISEIHINGERQSEVAPYYYIMSETNEFDVKIVFNTSNIPSMHAMFEYCDALTCVDFKHLKLDKGSLKDTSYMFSYCYSLIELKNLEYFDTSNVIDMRNMFQECYSIGCTNGRGLKPNDSGGPASVDNLGVMPLSYNIQPYEIEQPEYNDSSSCQGGTIDIKHDNNC